MYGILKEEGFARLPRRADEERPAAMKPEKAPAADASKLDLSPRRFRTQFGGLFLFMPFIAAMPFDEIMARSKLPGSRMVPAGCAMRSLLALKLWCSARHGHVMDGRLDWILTNAVLCSQCGCMTKEIRRLPVFTEGRRG